MSINLKQSLIDNQSVVLNAKASSWEEATKIGTDLLVKSGAIEPRYYDRIIASVKELGPYIILAPGLAMPHARPEDGVLKTAFALVTLEEPVYFEGEDEGVRVFFVLAGADSTTHLDGLAHLVELLSDEESETGVDLNRVLNCKTVEDVYAMIDQFEG